MAYICMTYASHKDQTWQVQFPTCCAGNMELSTVTCPFANHKPGWTQVSRVQVLLHMTFYLQELLRSELTYLLAYLLTVKS